jgi:hypothetical protein
MQKNKTDIVKALNDVKCTKDSVNALKLIIEKLDNKCREELLDFISDLNPMLKC